KNDVEIYCLITGVGQMQTAFHLGQTLARLPKFDLAINAGIAGAFDRSLALGEVVHIVSETLGDLGIEEADGRFVDLCELELLAGNQFPFSQNRLINETAQNATFLKTVHGLTVNRVHGFEASITKIEQKYDCQVESMEGAAFFYACLLSETPFFEIRAISNYVEPRNRANWKIALAIENLNKVLMEMIDG
ncbi:MAG: hypothetical protein RLZZ292_2117, partial [Bacteroidota bacterium]